MIQQETKAMSENNQTEKMSIKDEICDWLDTMLFAILIVMLVFTFLVRQIGVIGPSMQKTLIEGDRLIISNWFYTPENGDIIVAWSDGLKKNIVKRVIAKEGQKVDINFETGQVYVDDVELRESYINTLTLNDEGGQEYPFIVPEDCYFVMGDNRLHSEDSRSSLIGFVNKDDILGKVIFRIYPFNKFGGLYD